MSVPDDEKPDLQEVLVVDDAPAILQLLTHILTRHGYRVRPASGGLLALRTVAARVPDIILLDVNMPDLDGFEVCRRLKADERSRGVPVLFLSGSGETIDKVKGFEAGGVDYITKPFESEEVLARIRTHLKLRDLTDRLREAKETLERRVEERTATLDQTNRELQQEIVERKQVEHALRESEERYRIITDAAQDAIITFIDESSTIIFANPAAEKIFGYTIAELQGKPLTMVMPERMRQAHARGVKRHIVSGKRRLPWGPVEQPGLHKDGREIPLEITYGAFAKEGEHLFVGIARDISERKRAEETIKYQAYHDLLTGLPNRALFVDLLNHEISQMQRIAKKLAVLFLDVDQFKNINDSLGHAAGDTLIREVAFRLRSCLRENDAVARIGGDDFTLLLPLLNRSEDAAKTAEAIREALKKPFVIDANELGITASMGISIYPEDGRNADVLLKNADIAMYHAKEQGRDNFQFYNASINVRTLERVIFENRLRRAVEREELVVYYQPLQNIKTREITGAEALVRWRHPELGLLNPAQFIPLAEEIGLIGEIDQWVMRTACAQLKAWQEAGHGLRRITVNLSARQFQLPGLAEIVSEALKETGLCPDCLGIEITETLAMQDTELTARNLNSLNDMGVRFLIDDFGTGYSSLSYLKKLPIHKLKIDRSFIANLAKDSDYQAIVNAMIAMGHILKLKIVAEGVEREDQVSFLKSAECDEMQGFVYSRPVPAEEFEKLLILLS